MTHEQSAYIQKLSNFRCFVHLWRSYSSEGFSKQCVSQRNGVSDQLVIELQFENQCQRVVEGRHEIDFNRAAKFSLIGFFWVGPWVRFCLNRINNATSVWWRKIVLDMTFLMPPNMMVVNMVKPILDQKSIEETFEIWKHKTPEIIRNGWIYWTPVSGKCSIKLWLTLV